MKKTFRIATWMSLVAALFLLLPILYLSSMNRATGDDYGYGRRTRIAWVESHSLVEVGKAACRTVERYYHNWQGTWFSIFVFSLQPEVFSDKAYIVVAFIMLFLWIGSTLYLFRQILHVNMKMDKWNYLLLAICFLIINIEFIPSTKSSIYWFNGCAHYILPFSMCQMVTAWLFQYSMEYKKSTLFWITAFMILLGGSNYQAALFALIVTAYIGVGGWFMKKDKRILALLIPASLELIGLIVSMKSPGNLRRAGEEFGVSVSRVVQTIGYSFLYGIRDIWKYITEKPLVFVGLFVLFLILIIVFCSNEEVMHFRHPIWLSLMLFCLYSAMQSPALYAGVEVSGGVPNTNFQVFLLSSFGILMVIAEKISKRIKAMKTGISVPKILQVIWWGGIVLSLVMVLLFRSNIKTSTSFVSLAYIVSGQAKDYKDQMDLQTKLMEDENIKDVIVPEVNDVQGPLMHMPVTDDSAAWSNMVTAQFYGKRSVVAMERSEWIRLYGETGD